MNANDKRERRKLRHALQAAVLKNHFGVWKFRATNAQLRVGARKVTDQLLAGKNPAQVKVLESR